MHYICPECRNTIEQEGASVWYKEQVVECPMCGISLLVNDVKENVAIVEVTDEGK